MAVTSVISRLTEHFHSMSCERDTMRRADVMSLCRSGCEAGPDLLSESMAVKTAVPEVPLYPPFTVNVGREETALTINVQKPH